MLFRQITQGGNMHKKGPKIYKHKSANLNDVQPQDSAASSTLGTNNQRQTVLRKRSRTTPIADGTHPSHCSGFDEIYDGIDGGLKELIEQDDLETFIVRAKGLLSEFDEINVRTLASTSRFDADKKAEITDDESERIGKMAIYWVSNELNFGLFLAKATGRKGLGEVNKKNIFEDVAVPVESCKFKGPLHSEPVDRNAGVERIDGIVAGTGAECVTNRYIEEVKSNRFSRPGISADEMVKLDKNLELTRKEV
jgi:hypothetical protein